MNSIPYDSTRKSLYSPGLAEDFFQLYSGAFSDAALCAEMSRLAYVKDLNRLDTYLARAGYVRNLAVGYGTAGTQLFIAVNTEKNAVVISFRGTEPDDPSDLFTDADFRKAQWLNNSNEKIGEVHHGFADALTENGILQKILASVNALPEIDKIMITGHSLGAALATLTASRIPKAYLYTYGSCLVGDEQFANAMSNVKHERYVDCCDAVTLVPPSLFGYQHVGTMHYIDMHGKLLIEPTEAEISDDRLSARIWYFKYRFYLFGHVNAREFADHSPINYLSGVVGNRS